MAAIFRLPKSYLTDGDGAVLPSGSVQFYDAGTTTQQTVYSDSALSSALSQPIQAGADGLLPVIYLTAGTYKIIVRAAPGEGEDPGDATTLYTADNLDSGLPSGSGAVVTALPDFFAAETAAEARTALAAASQADVDSVTSDVSDILSGAGGAVAALAGYDEVSRDLLEAGFGRILLQDSVIDSDATVVTCSTATPYDDSIPQKTEGTEILSASFTPISASSLLQIDVLLEGALSASNHVCVALYKDTDADAIAAIWHYVATVHSRLFLRHRMSSPGTSAITFAVRVGGATGTFYVNGATGGTRIGGGVSLASINVKEWLSI